jgi:hypothetical protein
LLPGIDLSQEVDRLLEEVNDEDILSRNDDDEVEGDRANLMVGKLAKLDLNPPQNRFFGKSRYVSHSCDVISSSITFGME